VNRGALHNRVRDYIREGSLFPIMPTSDFFPVTKSGCDSTAMEHFIPPTVARVPITGWKVWTVAAVLGINIGQKIIDGPFMSILAEPRKKSFLINHNLDLSDGVSLLRWPLGPCQATGQ